MKVILINGLIASGKSTLAQNLAVYLSTSIHKTEYLDMDLFFERVNSKKEYEGDKKREGWLLARKNSAMQILEIIKEDRNVVIAGPFYYKDEICGVTNYLAGDYDLYVFTLDTSLDIRLKRNKDRIPTNDPKDIIEQEKYLKRNPALRIGQTINNSKSLEDTLKDIQLKIKNNYGLINKNDLV